MFYDNCNNKASRKARKEISMKVYGIRLYEYGVVTILRRLFLTKEKADDCARKEQERAMKNYKASYYERKSPLARRYPSHDVIEIEVEE